MVKHTQTIRRQFPNELFECVWPFCWIGAEKVNSIFQKKKQSKNYALKELEFLVFEI